MAKGTARRSRTARAARSGWRFAQATSGLFLGLLPGLLLGLLLVRRCVLRRELGELVLHDGELCLHDLRFRFGHRGLRVGQVDVGGVLLVGGFGGLGLVAGTHGAPW